MAPAPSSIAQDGDLLGGLDDIAKPSEAVPLTNPTPAVPSNDLFGDLSVKSVDNVVSNTPQVSSSFTITVHTPMLSVLINLVTAARQRSSIRSCICFRFHEYNSTTCSASRNTGDSIHTRDSIL
jgi:hypothetical protein